MTIEVSILISVISVSFAVFFGISNNRRATTDEIEKRTIEHTRTDMKLDEIGRNVSDIKYDISATKKEVSCLCERVASVEASHKSEHKRLDHIERVLDLQREGVDSEE